MSMSIENERSAVGPEGGDDAEVMSLRTATGQLTVTKQLDAMNERMRAEAKKQGMSDSDILSMTPQVRRILGFATDKKKAEPVTPAGPLSASTVELLGGIEPPATIPGTQAPSPAVSGMSPGTRAEIKNMMHTYASVAAGVSSPSLVAVGAGKNGGGR